MSSVHQYLQLCSSYNDQSAVLYYQKPPVLSQKYSKEQELDATMQLSNIHLETDSSPLHLPAPTLPLKKKQQVTKETLVVVKTGIGPSVKEMMSFRISPQVI